MMILRRFGMSSNERFFNENQSRIHLINANVTHCLWPRAEGKTSGGAGQRLVHLSQVMPRSQCILYTDTYERVEGTIIPNIRDFYNNHIGLIEGLDYVVCQTPPDHWVKPLIAPTKYKRVITFNSGFSICFGAADTDGSVNGFNAQSAIIDETKFVNRKRIKSQLYKALRGARHLFGLLPEYRSVWSFTDKFEGDIEWLIQLRDKQDQTLINAVLTEAIYIEKLKIESGQFSSSSTLYKYKTEIDRRTTRLNEVRKELVYVSDAKPFANAEILGKKFYRDARRDCDSIFEYNVAILNKDPDNVENTFYPGFSKKLFYTNSMIKDKFPNYPGDVVEEEDLIASLDYQWKITPMVVGQLGILPGNEEYTHNIVNGIHSLHPNGGIEKTVKGFCDFYSYRENKVVYYVYDHTATGKRPDGKCFKDIAIEQWENNGWTVIEIHIGAAPAHDLKHETFKPLMYGRKVMFNEPVAWALIKSMKHAGIKRVGNKSQKQKGGEKLKTRDPIKETDYSDALDMQIWATLVMNLITPSVQSISTSSITIRTSS